MKTAKEWVDTMYKVDFGGSRSRMEGLFQQAMDEAKAEGVASYKECIRAAIDGMNTIEAQGGIEALEWAVNVAESEFTSRRATGCGINGVASVIETIRAEIERRKTERSRRNGVLFCKRDAQSS